MADIEKVLDALPADRATATAKAMIKHGVRDGDPLVEAISIALDADAARQAAAEAARDAGEAARAVSVETAKIPDAIYQGTVKAGNDLKGQVEVAGKAIVEAAILRATEAAALGDAAISKSVEAGRGVLKQAVSDLSIAAREKRDALVQDMQAAALRAVEKQVREGMAARVARSYSVVAVSLLLAASIGACAALVGARLTGHLTPLGDRIATTPSGRPFCGPVGPGPGVEWSCLLTR